MVSFLASYDRCNITGVLVGIVCISRNLVEALLHIFEALPWRTYCYSVLQSRIYDFVQPHPSHPITRALKSLPKDPDLQHLYQQTGNFDDAHAKHGTVTFQILPQHDIELEIDLPPVALPFVALYYQMHRISEHWCSTL